MAGHEATRNAFRTAVAPTGGTASAIAFMSPPLVSRQTEAEAISNFLTLCCVNPAGLLFAGEAGIGKTTVWVSAVEQARALGMHVLTARAAATESVMAYIPLADLLSGVEAGVLYALPEPQRLAVDRVLLQVSETDVATDQRAVAAAFLSAVEILAEDAPVLVAIDDLQWLDPSSALVIGFAARRFAGPVGILGTVRTGDGPVDLSWLQLPPPHNVQRIDLRPLSIGGLQQVVTTQLGRTPSRRRMVRIHEASRGNPFYAIELARAAAEGDSGGEVTLPDTLSDLVAAKVAGLDADVREALLAAACLATPTVDVVSQAIGETPEHCARTLAVAETRGIVIFDGERLRFTHPLLVAAVNSDATPSQRRDMHRRLAPVVDHPELRARHLALGATHGDPATLESLDAAAETARIRGAPIAAAELVDLAIGLGGDTAARRIRSAALHFNAGDSAQARRILEPVVEGPAPAKLKAEALNLLGLMSHLEGNVLDGSEELERALLAAQDDLALRVKILVSLSWIQTHNVGQLTASARSIEDAVAGATRLKDPHLLSQALGMSAVVHVLLGDGLEEELLRQALELENQQSAMSAMFRPIVHDALVSAWTGQLAAAHDKFLAIRRTCIERGEESELVFVTFHQVLNEIWRANFAEAVLIAEDTVQRARQLSGTLPLAAALTVRALLAAYTGRANDARRDVDEAIGPMRQSGSQQLTAWTVAVLGFLEISLGNYDAAITALEPLLDRVTAAPHATEIFVAWFVPDAIEALINVGRVDDAEPLIEALESNGRRLDRPWMLAVGGRCRAMVLVARGDLKAAMVAAEGAMAEHDRLPMPFERARTQLLLGELQRRQRGREKAAATLRGAEAAFVALGTQLWATRARTLLERIALGSNESGVLTSAEQRVAELAAAGKTNHDIASSLFISPKTVEVHLSRIYRKLDIRSRAELGRRLDRLAEPIDPDAPSI
jgi:DNA-binding CsgD family transcriptional regulator